MSKFSSTRRRLIASLCCLPVLALIVPAALAASAVGEDALKKKFDHLSANGNSTCSAKFMKSIATMPPGARLQGSCCSPMDWHRYVEQVQSLKKYKSISLIPDDPYDVTADLAAKLMSYYELSLNSAEQAAYDFAMANSDENGPCCCTCWRWHVYGGLAKLLIREKGFDGPQLVEVWNLSSGCGGGAEHHH